MKKTGFFFLQMLLLCSAVFGQNDTVNMRAPLDIPLLLSGNFGELRTNHFHAGIDFKTQGTVGKPIFSPADGYVARVKVSPGGYGRALYIMHDNGYMTVYGHLNAYTADIANRIHSFQYENETFAADISFAPEEFRVKRGELVAYSGNTGYSFGPHVHFEVRKSDGNELVNPLRFYKHLIADSRPPVAYAYAVTPYKGAGVVNRGSNTVTCKFAGDTLNVWGVVGVSVKAEDFMDNTTNRYGIYRYEMYVDDSLRFSSVMDGFSFDETRLINAWADYQRRSSDGDWYLRSYVLDNNPLRALSCDENRGWITIDEERIYNVKYRLYDYHGNVKSCSFALRGKCDTIPSVYDEEGHLLLWYINNEISYQGMHLAIPAGELFEDTYIKIFELPATDISRSYDIAGSAIPLRNGAYLRMQINDSLPYPERCYYLRRKNGKGWLSAGGKASNGWVEGKISVLGIYDVAVDTVAPRVKALNEKRWKGSGTIVFTLRDTQTGIKDYKGYIDDKFILFEFSSKTGRLTCNHKREGVSPGKHRLRLVVTDYAGNETIIEKTIIL